MKIPNHQKGKRTAVVNRQGFELHVNLETKAALIKVAEFQKRPVADVVRTAIGNYLHELGLDVDTKVTRGGYRGGKKGEGGE